MEYYTLGTNGLAESLDKSLDNLSCPIQARSRYLLEYFVQSRRDMWVYGCYRTPASGRAKFEALCVAFFFGQIGLEATENVRIRWAEGETVARRWERRLECMGWSAALTTLRTFFWNVRWHGGQEWIRRVHL